MGENPFQYTRVGVATIIWNTKNEILMGLRKGKHGAGTWSLPGGWMEFGESPTDTASREILEETGLRVPVGSIHPWSRIPYTNTLFQYPLIHNITLIMETAHHAHEHFIINDIGEEEQLGNPKVVLKEPDKCERWEWFPHYDLPDPLFAPLTGIYFRSEVKQWPCNPKV
jgi:8-oxo-dGTP diphosphatase